jgi:hypothetical protein
MTRMYRATSMSAAQDVKKVADKQLMYPLDVVKTRQQLSTASKGTGIVSTLSEIVKQEG